jgi:hypothetical protein
MGIDTVSSCFGARVKDEERERGKERKRERDTEREREREKERERKQRNQRVSRGLKDVEGAAHLAVHVLKCHVERWKAKRKYGAHRRKV